MTAGGTETRIAPEGRSGLLRSIGRLAPANVAVLLLGFGSSIVLASTLGATTTTDAFFLAYSVATFGYAVLWAALRQGAIPLLTGIVTRDSPEAFATGCSELFGASIVGAAILSAVTTIVMIVVLPFTASGSPHLVALAREYMIELSPYAVSGAALGALSAVLAVRKTFVVPALVLGIEAVFKSVLILAFPRLGAQALVLGSLVGNLVAVAILWHLIHKRGIAIRLRGIRLAGFRGSPLVRSVFKLAGPLAIGQTILQVNPLIDRATAAGLGAGNVTAFELATRLYGAATVLLGVTLIAPLAADWSARLGRDGWESVGRSFSRVVRAVVIIVPPVTVAAFLFRDDFVSLVYRNHAYTTLAASRTADAFGTLALGLTAATLIVPLATLFVIRGNSVFPMKIAGVNAVLNAGLDIALRGPLGVAGIGLSTAMTYTILAVAYFVHAHRRLGSLYLGPVVRPAVVSALSCAATSFCCVMLLGVNHLGKSRAGEVGGIVLVLAIAIVIHSVLLVLGGVVTVGASPLRVARRPAIMVRR